MVNNFLKINVCIPTFNRAEYLDILLNSLHKASQNNSYVDLSVFISDNNSGDSTKDVVYEWGKKLKIHYHKQIENVGPLINLVSALELSINEPGYNIICGDDDKYSKSIFSYLLKVLTVKKCDIVLINRYVCDANLNIINKDSYFDIDKNIYISFNESNSYIKYINKIKTLNGLLN